MTNFSLFYLFILFYFIFGYLSGEIEVVEAVVSSETRVVQLPGIGGQSKNDDGW